MPVIEFSVSGTRPDGEKLYSLSIHGKPIKDGLTIDEVIREITRRDELRLGEDHVGRKGGEEL